MSHYYSTAQHSHFCKECGVTLFHVGAYSVCDGITADNTDNPAYLCKQCALKTMSENAYESRSYLDSLRASKGYRLELRANKERAKRAKRKVKQ